MWKWFGFHICSVWETLIWNQWPFLTGISQTINHLQYRFLHRKDSAKDAIGKARCMNHHDPMNMRTFSKQKSTSSKPVVRSDMHQHPSKGRVHWFHLRMESNKTITCTKWSNQVKLIQTINRINSKSSARDQKFSVGNLHSFHGIRRWCCITVKLPSKPPGLPHSFQYLQAKCPQVVTNPKGKSLKHSHRFAFCKWSTQDG